MESRKVYRALGLMSGTSLDGEIDVALIETDGQSHVSVLDFYVHRYDKALCEPIRRVFGQSERNNQVKKAEDKVTDLHIQAVKKSGFESDIIGFHGQTIYHNPAAGITLQLGDGKRLAKETGMDVVCDFRSADVAAGGQGAPFLPLYHQARAGGLEKPIVILNLGGVANVTYISQIDEILAFDIGPGNALMDDYARLKTGLAFDKDGALAAKGTPRRDLIEHWLDHPHFYKHPPKSLDRDEWSINMVDGLSPEDGMATLLEFTVAAIDQADTSYIHGAPNWYACGGGRHNKVLMERLNQTLPAGIRPVEALGWNGDSIEAEGFAYLAVRSLLDLPLSLPSTTGVKEPLTGGVLHKAA